MLAGGAPIRGHSGRAHLVSLSQELDREACGLDEGFFKIWRTGMPKEPTLPGIAQWSHRLCNPMEYPAQFEVDETAMPNVEHFVMDEMMDTAPSTIRLNLLVHPDEFIIPDRSTPLADKVESDLKLRLPQDESHHLTTFGEWEDWIVAQPTYLEECGLEANPPVESHVTECTGLIRIGHVDAHKRTTWVRILTNHILPTFRSVGLDSLSLTVTLGFGVKSYIGNSLHYKLHGATAVTAQLHFKLADEKTRSEWRDAGNVPQPVMELVDSEHLVFENPSRIPNAEVAAQAKARAKLLGMAAWVWSEADGLDKAVFLPKFFNEEKERMIQHIHFAKGEARYLARMISKEAPEGARIKYHIARAEWNLLKPEKRRKVWGFHKPHRDLTLSDRFCAVLALVNALVAHQTWSFYLDEKDTQGLRELVNEIGADIRTRFLRASDAELGLLDSNRDALYHVLQKVKKEFDMIDELKEDVGGAQLATKFKFSWKPGKAKSEAWKKAIGEGLKRRRKVGGEAREAGEAGEAGLMEVGDSAS
eukprot:m.115424 g.115424  ORF g.115424 m.115424 type:complete len:532 (-) comp13092_c0_seq2:187-1782(-)